MVDEFEQIKSAMNEEQQEQTNQRETFQTLITSQMTQLNANQTYLKEAVKGQQDITADLHTFRQAYEQTKVQVNALATDHRLTTTRTYEEIGKIEKMLESLGQNKMDALNMQEIIHVQERSVREIRNL